MLYKKGLFYTIDAFIAFGILTVGVTLFLSGFVFSGSSDDPQLRADYIRDFFSNTRVTDLNIDYIVNSTNNGSIDDRTVSLFQQAIILYNSSGVATAEDFFGNISEEVFGLDDGDNYAIFINSELIFSAGDSDSFETSSFIFSSKDFVLAKKNNPIDIIGPYLVEVKLWL